MVNAQYPEITPAPYAPPSFEDFAAGIEARGYRRFDVGGPRLIVDTTAIAEVDWLRALHWVRAQL